MKKPIAMYPRAEGKFDEVENKDMGTPCWVWHANKDRNGYGVLSHRVSGKIVHRMAHKILWEHFNGFVPDGLELDHLCRNRAGVNPDHLEPVTHAENVRRGEAGQHNPIKTHCPKGHPYSESTYVVKSHPKGNFRRCNRCHEDRAKAARAKKKAQKSK